MSAKVLPVGVVPGSAIALALLLGLAALGPGFGTAGAPPDDGPVVRFDPTNRSVDIRGFAYVPRNITAFVNATVTWTNRDADAHTVTADDAAFDSYALGDPTETGETFEATFLQAGVHEYGCELHPSMRGRVIVYDAIEDVRLPIAKLAFRVSGATVHFDAAGSYDPDGSIVDYEWEFGDGVIGHGAATSHTYAGPGSYAVRLWTADDLSLVNWTDATVIIADPWLPVIALAGLGAATAAVAVWLRRRGRRKAA